MLRRAISRARRRNQAVTTTSLVADPRLLFWFEPEFGISDQATSGVFGPLATSGGPVTTGGSYDGHPAWQLAKASGGFLKTADPANTNFWYQPYHLFFVAAATGSPAAGDSWLASSVSANPRIQYQSATQLRLQTGVATNITTGNPNVMRLYELYHHSGQTRISINGGAYATLAAGTGGVLEGICIGASSTAGGSRADVDFLLALGYEGQAPDSFKVGLYAYLKAKFPTVLSAVT